MTTTQVLTDPFSDHEMESIMIIGASFNMSLSCALANEFPHKTANRPATIVVPILETLSPASSQSSMSSISTLNFDSTPPSSSATNSPNPPIQWDNADLMYLLSCIFPDLLLSDRLMLFPALDDLPTHSPSIHLQLFEKLPVRPPPPEAYSKHAPIGTGRPISKVLIAESRKMCTNVMDARRSLAYALLGDVQRTADVIDKFNVLVALHAMPKDELQSVLRGMLLMSYVTDAEWSGRLMQFHGFARDGTRGQLVDGTSCLQARLELYLLEMGRGELEGWVRSVSVALGLGEQERGVWAGVYEAAARFLGRAYGEMCFGT